MTRIGTLYQRETSLLNGDRTRPIQPLHRRPGAVRIGNRRILMVAPAQFTEAELSRTGEEWEQTVASKRRAHECISLEMGEPCPHID